jgi:hypothetical protein
MCVTPCGLGVVLRIVWEVCSLWLPVTGCVCVTVCIERGVACAVCVTLRDGL